LQKALESGDVHTAVADWTFELGGNVEEIYRDLAKMESYAFIYSGFNVSTTRTNLIDEMSHLDPAMIDRGLQRYQEVFSRLFEWAREASLKWFHNDGAISYFLNAQRSIPVPGWMKPDADKIMGHKSGRTAINAYGQQSVGLLCKCVLHHMLKSDLVRTNIDQVLPLFDAIYMLCDVDKVHAITQEMEKFATPILRFEGREIRMKADWKASTESWGAVKHIDIEPTPEQDAHVYEWEDTLLAPPAPLDPSINPFIANGPISSGIAPPKKAPGPVNPMDLL